MSRCFPFPPPGYERQARSDHVDLLAKEKQKEKKRKKEKKDKEKREGKDKKDKDRSKDKHKDKKDRKEKDRDKKKEKEREKDKNPSEGVRADKLNEPNHYELGECSQKAKETNHSKFTEDLDRRIKDEQKVAASRMVENFSVPLHRSIGHTASPSPIVDRVAGNRVIQSSMVDSQKRDVRVEKPANNHLSSAQRTDVLGFSNAMQKEKNTSRKVAPKLDQKGDSLSFANAMQKEKNTIQVAPKLDQKGDSLSFANAMQKEKNTIQVASKLEQKGDILGLDNVVQRDHFAGQRLAPKIEQKGDIGTEAALRNSKVSIRKPEGFTVTASAEKESKSKKSDSNSDSFVERTINGMSQMSQPRNRMSQPRNGMSQPPEALSNLPRENTPLVHLSTKIEKKIDAEKNHNLVGQRDVDGIDRLMDKGGQRLASGTDKMEDQCRKEEKQKDRDHKKHKSKHKDKDKEKVKETTEKSERRKKEHDELRDKGKEDQIDGPKLKHIAAQVVDAKSQLPNGIIKKRKEVEANGFLHENGPRLSKFLKTTPSHHPVENESRFPVSPVATNCLSVKPEATNNAIAGQLPIVSKNHVTNGISKAPPLSAPSRHPDMTDISAANGVSLKPHPDDKYLSQIYSVPKMEEWQECDEQEWLFSSNRSQQKRQLTRDAVEPPQVWAEALRIESDDVIAMPYVIPF